MKGLNNLEGNLSSGVNGTDPGWHRIQNLFLMVLASRKEASLTSRSPFCAGEFSCVHLNAISPRISPVLVSHHANRQWLCHHQVPGAPLGSGCSTARGGVNWGPAPSTSFPWASWWLLWAVPHTDQKCFPFQSISVPKP